MRVLALILPLALCACSYMAEYEVVVPATYLPDHHAEIAQHVSPPEIEGIEVELEKPIAKKTRAPAPQFTPEQLAYYNQYYLYYYQRYMQQQRLGQGNPDYTYQNAIRAR